MSPEAENWAVQVINSSVKCVFRCRCIHPDFKDPVYVDSVIILWVIVLKGHHLLKLLYYLFHKHKLAAFTNKKKQHLLQNYSYHCRALITSDVMQLFIFMLSELKQIGSFSYYKSLDSINLYVTLKKFMSLSCMDAEVSPISQLKGAKHRPLTWARNHMSSSVMVWKKQFMSAGTCFWEKFSHMSAWLKLPRMFPIYYCGKLYILNKINRPAGVWIP